jgi:hypothetical protein
MREVGQRAETERKKSLGHNIKIGIVWVRAGQLNQVRDKWRALTKTVMNFQIP